MRRDRIDGRPTGVKGVITAEDQLAALGLDKTAPKPAPLPLTPAQARARMSDEWPAEDLAPPDYERSVVSDPESVAQAMGARPEDFDAVPLGSAPEGMPIPRPSIRPKIERKAAEPSTATASPSPPPPSSQGDAAARAQLAADFRAHAAKVSEMAEAAKASGDATREAKAAAEVAASRQVGEQLKARGIL